MTMSRKHYEAVAESIRIATVDHGVSDSIRDIGDDLANMFAEDNPRFDRQRFLDACGL